MKIGQLANTTGLSAHTIRYYERIGLLPFAPRDDAKQRQFDASSIIWIEFLGRLKSTGMPIRDMLRYAKLRESGVSTNPERLALLKEHREHVREHISELNASLLLLDSKIESYDVEKDAQDDKQN